MRSLLQKAVAVQTLKLIECHDPPRSPSTCPRPVNASVHLLINFGLYIYEMGSKVKRKQTHGFGTRVRAEDRRTRFNKV